jgi:hypothetical protein
MEYYHFARAGRNTGALRISEEVANQIAAVRLSLLMLVQHAIHVLVNDVALHGVA